MLMEINNYFVIVLFVVASRKVFLSELQTYIYRLSGSQLSANYLFVSAGLLYDAVPAVTVISPAEPHSDVSAVNKVTSAAHLARESSVQSDVTSHTGSHCSSVDSYLESRRPDPEEILLGLGFGGPVGGASGFDTELSRVPHRFLQPSKVS